MSTFFENVKAGLEEAVEIATRQHNHRKIYRHANNKGSVIEFDMYGRHVKMFVPDAKYRPSATYWCDNDNDALCAIETPDHMICDEWTDCTEPLPKVYNDFELQRVFNDFKQDNSAKDNTDSLIKRGSPAAYKCRDVDVGLGKCDLPNVYELMIIFLESDRLDDLDPTFKEYNEMGLGRKNKHGRFSDNELTGSYWSSSSVSVIDPICISFCGHVGVGTNWDVHGIVPILEL